MRLPSSLGHLTYCSNIHPGESLAEVEHNLRQYLPAVKDSLSPSEPFGVGLRLSAAAAGELGARATALADLRSWMRDSDLYVFTLNGFPYGPFHGTPVKAEVYKPDWRSDERLQYSNRLADVLAELLRSSSDIGTISTVPGAYKMHLRHAADVDQIRKQLIRHAAHLYRIEASQERRIALALEPEPCCFLETIAETTDFFDRHIYSERSIAEFSDLTGNTRGLSADLLSRYLGVCLDTCHAAVEFEEPRKLLQALRQARVEIKKMQLSTGLRIPRVTPEHIEALQGYRDPVYLHQVVQRRGEELQRFEDLHDAMAAHAIGDTGEAASEWRIHFHVPIFLATTPPFESTQGFLEEMLRLHRLSPFTEHLEVETYTWSVLPKALQSADLVTSIVRELRWAQELLCAP